MSTIQTIGLRAVVVSTMLIRDAINQQPVTFLAILCELLFADD